MIRGLTITLPLLAMASVTNELLRRRLEFLRRIIPDTTSSIVGAAVAIALVFNGEGVMALVIGQIVQGVLTLLLSWCVHRPVRPGWHREDARGLLAYGGPLAGGNLLQLVQLNVDYLIVSVMLGAAALGQYSLAFRLAFMPYLMIAVIISGAAFPFLCGLRRARFASASVAVMSATVALITPICLGLLVLADHLTLLGEKWSPGVPVVALLAGYAWMLSVSQLVQTSLNASGRPGISMSLRLVHLVLLTSTLLVVGHRGIVAVALAQLVVAVLEAGLALLVTRVVISGFSLRELGRSLRPTVYGALLMGGAMLLARVLLGDVDVSMVKLLVTGSVGLVAYAVPVWLLDRPRLTGLLTLIRGSR